MTYVPAILYNIAENHDLINKENVMWNEEIPVNRHGAFANAKKSLSYGDYFSAVGNFLSDNDFLILINALHAFNGSRVSLADIKNVTVCLIKHGAFYHPSVVIVEFFNEIPVRFVTNVAVSPEGKKLIKSEYDFFKSRFHKKIMHYVPDVYGFGEVKTDYGFQLPMFIGEWFDDYHEFHLSRDGEHIKQIVWDGNGYFYLSHEQETDLYHQAAKIMAGFYDIKKCKRITQWHHASGDFIVKKLADKISLRLITVRGYEPLMENDGSVEAMFNCLLIFFMDITVKMRLDRFDGIGEIAWAGDRIVKGVVTGFFEGLRINRSVEFDGFTMDELFAKYILGFDENSFLAAMKAVSRSYHPQAQDSKIIMDKLESHSKFVFETCRKCLPV